MTKWRVFSLALGLTVVLGGCSRGRMAMDAAHTKPAPHPEMQRLARMVGTWSGTAEVVEPDVPGSFKGTTTSAWALGGQFLRNEGGHEMGEGQSANYVEMITWDPRQNAYRSWYFSDWGEHGTGEITVSDDGSCWCVKSRGFDAAGNRKTGEGCVTFLSDNTQEWTWTEKGGPAGRMRLKGTATRQP